MKRNGMCPICFLKQLFTPNSRITNVDIEEEYDNGVAQTPPMGWSSWNTFKNNIDQDMILDTAKAMKEKGLVDAGYRYLNLDDCWHANLRDENDELQGDMVRFSMGMQPLVQTINGFGLKVGTYSSNGTYTCEDLPASLGREEKDALTIARWGFEFFKYDFCHNIAIPSYAPLVYSIEISQVGNGKVVQKILCDQAVLRGTARLMPTKKVEGNKYISGMDKAKGEALFDNVYVEEGGEYILTINVFKKGMYDKFLRAKVGDQAYYFEIPPQKKWNVTARFSQKIQLKKGVNQISLTNPVGTRADSSMFQYYKMGQALKKASERVAKENNAPLKPIVFSVCEWGRNQPYLWANKVGNMWRTTPDIMPKWWWIKQIYEHNVKLYQSASIGHYNDPDMLEVGNGNLTLEQNKSHFALWCMMSAPLMLGNDIRSITQDVLDIVTNADMIAIDQDKLGKQAKRIIKGGVDILAKPLEKGVAVCLFNKKSSPKTVKVDWNKIGSDEYIQANWTAGNRVVEVWTGKEYELQDLSSVNLQGGESKVFIIK